MFRREKVRGLVFSRRDLGEADRVVTLFTRERGLFRVLAPGVRKIPSRRGGHGEPFTEILALVAGREGRHFLAAAETVDYFKALYADADALERAEIMARCVRGLFEEDDAQPDLYEILRDAWQRLPELSPAARCVLEVTVVLLILRAGGVLPHLRACQRCGQTDPGEAVVLDDQRGGWVCLSCSPTLAKSTLSITRRGLAVLRFVVARPREAGRLKIEEDEASQLNESVRVYIGYVLYVAGHGAPAGKLRYHGGDGGGRRK